MNSNEVLAYPSAHSEYISFWFHSPTRKVKRRRSLMASRTPGVSRLAPRAGATHVTVLGVSLAGSTAHFQAW